MEPRRLKGHKGALTCCIASRSRPGVVASSGEDGRICGFDLRSDGAMFDIDVGEESVTSLCFKAGNEDVIFASAGCNVYSFDIRMASFRQPLETYGYNKDEINQIAFSSKSDFLAAADDSGEVKIIDTHRRSLYKTLRAAHSSVSLFCVLQCLLKNFHGSSVQFLYWKPWTAITGGLDSKLVTWDFSKGRPLHIVNYALPEESGCCSSNAGQCFNPPFVHSVATSEVDALAGLKVCAVARGDGIVEVIDMESDLAGEKSGSSRDNGRKMRPKEDRHRQAENATANSCVRKRAQLDYALGGHTSAVSCVSFAVFGDQGRFLVSGGNDACVKLWEYSKHFLAGQTGADGGLPLNINVNKKINWLCTTPADSDNLIVCDTTKVLKAYTVA